LPLLVTEIKGGKEPNRFVLVNGHVDTPPYCMGATDNISGDTAILEVARILNKHKDKLRRSVRIAYWTGHEIGKYAGSTYYNDAFWHDSATMRGELQHRLPWMPGRDDGPRGPLQ